MKFGNSTKSKSVKDNGTLKRIEAVELINLYANTPDLEPTGGFCTGDKETAVEILNESNKVRVSTAKAIFKAIRSGNKVSDKDYKTLGKLISNCNPANMRIGLQLCEDILINEGLLEISE